MPIKINYYLILICPKTEAYIQMYKGTNFFIDTALFYYQNNFKIW